MEHEEIEFEPKLKLAIERVSSFEILRRVFFTFELIFWTLKLLKRPNNPHA